MQAKKRRAIIITALVVVIALGISGYRYFMVQADLSLGNFQVQDLSGEEINLTQMVGKPMIVEVWATWCPPCRESLPHLEAIKSKYSDQLDVFLVSDEPVETIVAFKNEHTYDLLYYLKSKIAMQDFGVRIIPTSYYYNAKGELVGKHTGTVDEELLESFLQKML